jgi:glycosyltransferase involved in cell wall biosynthesis
MVGLVPPEMGGGLDCGVASHVWDLAQQTARRGYEITVLAPLGRKKSYRDDSGIEVQNATRCRSARFIRSLIHLRRQTPIFKSGSKAPLSINPYYTPGFSPGSRMGLIFGSRFSSACRSNLALISLRERIGVLAWTRTLAETLKQREPDLIHIHPLGHPLALGLDCLNLRIPVVLTDHGFWQDIHGERDLEKIRRTAGNAAGIIAVSRHCVEQEDRLGIQVKGMRTIILNPFDFPSASIPLLPAESSPAGRKVVLFVAGVEPIRRKGLDLVLDAFVRNDDLRKSASLHIVTNEEGRDFAKPIIKARAIDGQVFPCQPRGRLLEMVATADTVVLPSRSEAFGLVLLEAVAAGVPIVGFAPTIGEFHNCMKIDVGESFDADTESSDDLARKIESVLSRPFDRKIMAERTREAFSWATLFPLYDKFYRSVIGS